MENNQLKLEKLEIVKCGPYRFVGESVYKGNKRGGEGIFDYMWKHSDWVFKELDAMAEYASDIIHNAALIPWDKCDSKSELFGYYVGRFMKPNTPVTKEVDLDYFDIPEGYIAKALMKGNKNKRYGIYAYKDDLVYNAIEKPGVYRAQHYIWAAEGFPQPDENGESFVWAYIPCEKI